MLGITWFTDEAWFKGSDYVTLQNSNRIWAAEQPYVFHEEPLHPEKVGA
jgi:hypothetical protein